MSSATARFLQSVQRLRGDAKINGRKFALVLTLQALVYAIFGTENSLVPSMAVKTFKVLGSEKTLITIALYGVCKAVANVAVTPLNALFGRHNTHRLGWFILGFNPFMIIYAPDWGTVIGAYVLLGFSQGLQSCTDNQYVQQLIPNSQGFASGIYETTSYISLAIMGVVAAKIAKDQGASRPGPQLLGLGLIILGTLISAYIPHHDPQAEAAQDKTGRRDPEKKKKFLQILLETTFTRRVPALSCFAGVMIQISVGLAWTLMPLYWNSLNLTDAVVIASITATFNAIRGVVQLFSGFASDVIGGRLVVSFGFALAGLSFVLCAGIPNANPEMPQLSQISLWVGCSALLGLGVGCVYPVMSAEIGKVTASEERDVALTIFRFWREMGYAFGAAISVPILGRESIATCVIIIGIMMWAASVILFFFYGQELFYQKWCCKDDRKQLKEETAELQSPSQKHQAVTVAPDQSEAEPTQNYQAVTVAPEPSEAKPTQNHQTVAPDQSEAKPTQNHQAVTVAPEQSVTKRNVLFLCTGNSCRSHMAEAIANARIGDLWNAVSAGTKPAGYVHPKAIIVLAEIGIQHTGTSKDAEQFRDMKFDLVVTVCDNAAQSCPEWLGSRGKVIHLPFDDPAHAEGTEEEILAVFRRVRDEILEKVVVLLKTESH